MQIAEEKQRPEFNRIVIQDVYDAFKNKTDHPLKALVLKANVKGSVYLTDETEAVLKLKNFCGSRLRFIVLAKVVGTSADFLRKIAYGTAAMTEAMQMRLENAYADATELLKDERQDMTATEMKMLRKLCEKHGMAAIICNLTGMSTGNFSSTLKRRNKLTPVMWARIKPILGQAQAVHAKQYPCKRKPHKSICPCAECVESKAKQLHQITEKYCGVAA